MRTGTLATMMTAVVFSAACMAEAALLRFEFPITVDQEVPAPTLPGGPGNVPAGVGFIDYDTETNLLAYEIHYAGLTGPIVSPGAHIHGTADYGETAGILFFLAGGDSPSPLPQPPSGTLTGVIDITTNGDADEADLLNGLWYVNIHTEQNGPGEIRGQIVPEPASIGLLAGAGLLALRRRH